VNPEDYLTDVESKMWFNFNLHVSISLNWLNLKFACLKATGYEITQAQKLAVLMKGLSQEKDSKRQWLDFKIKIRDNRKIYDSNFGKVEKEMMKYWS
jgi:hypothetical protein